MRLYLLIKSFNAKESIHCMLLHVLYVLYILYVLYELYVQYVTVCTVSYKGVYVTCFPYTWGVMPQL